MQLNNPHVRRRFLLLACASLALAGCVTPPPPAPPATDRIGEALTKNASEVTAAVRRLSEIEGTTRAEFLRKPAVAEAAPAHVSVEAQTGLPTLAGTARANAPAETPATLVLDKLPAGGVPEGLNTKISLRAMSDDIERILDQIAEQSGWSRGPSTGLKVSPVIVAVKAEGQTAYELLRDLGAIAGHSADIVVTPASKSISVRYPQRGIVK